MHRTKHGIARKGDCRVTGDHLVPANEPHQLNLDAAQRELDRRAAEGEDVSGLRVNPKTYAIEPAMTPQQLQRKVSYLEARLAAAADDLTTCYRWLQQAGRPVDADFALGRANAYRLPMPAALLEPVDAATQADLDRDFNKGPKLARRNDAAAFDRQTGADQVRVVLGFEQRELDERDRNLARAWSGLESSDLDLDKK